MSDDNKEKLLNLYPIPITIECTKIILEQMENCICKINNEKGNGTGFFCYISNYNKYIMLTNNHVIDEEIIKNNNKIIVTINDDKEEIEINLNNKKLYTSEKYDVTIIEIKEEKNKIKKYLELDNNIFKENINIYNKTLYILQYPKSLNDEQKCAVSYGILKGIKDEYNIIHLCSTESGSSGSPILNISNNKVIGIHKEGGNKYNYNIGTYLKYTINEYLNNINLIEKSNEMNNKINNEIIITLKIEKEDINKDIYFLDNTDGEYWNGMVYEEHHHDNLKELNELNVELYINNIKYKYKKYFNPKNEGNYEIKLKFNNNITDCSYMFCNCNNITNLNLSSFDTKNVTNMSGMFYYCNKITNLNLSSFDTKNVTNMSDMFWNCNKLILMKIKKNMNKILISKLNKNVNIEE